MCYDPDFVALGNVIKGFLRPDLVIIGESMPEAGERMEAIHRKLCENKPSISRMSLISAEVAKVCLNVYITFKISIANSIANLCEAIPGADVDAITSAIGADRRISPHYFRGGLSFGGTCFPRDTHAYKAIAAKHNVQADMILAATRVNEYQDRHLAGMGLLENPDLNLLYICHYRKHKTNRPAGFASQMVGARALRFVDLHCRHATAGHSGV